MINLGLGLVDFGARMEDRVLGRWWVIDPLAEVSRRFSPFAFSMNNPINFIDPDGMSVTKIDGGYSLEGADAVNLFTELQQEEKDKDKKEEPIKGSFPNGACCSAASSRTAQFKATGDNFTPEEKAAQLGVNIAGTVEGGYSIFKGGSSAFKSLLNLKTILSASSKSVWSLSPFARGVAIEKLLGQNLPSNFPTIDKFAGGVATSIKSIDLNAVSYQNMATLERTLEGYVDAVSGFNGLAKPWAGASVPIGQVTSRALEVAIPAGPITPSQLTVFTQIQKYAFNSSNPVVVKFIPIQ